MDDKNNFASKLEKIFDCSITLERLKNPVVTTVGQTYSRYSIATLWCLIQCKTTDPNTNTPISTTDFIPNHFIENLLSKDNFTDQDITCPFSGIIMMDEDDPVIGSNGATYKRSEIDKFIGAQRKAGIDERAMEFPDGQKVQFIFKIGDQLCCYIKNYAAASFIRLYQDHKLEFESYRKQLRKEIQQYGQQLQQAEYARFYKQQQKQKQHASIPTSTNYPQNPNKRF